MESMTALRSQTGVEGGGAIRRARPPLEPKEQRSIQEDNLNLKALNIDERTRRQEIRQKKRINPTEVAS